MLGHRLVGVSVRYRAATIRVKILSLGITAGRRCLSLIHILTIVFVIGMALMGFDYGPMVKHERNAREKGDLFTEGERVVNADNAPKGCLLYTSF